ncbi:hypothetical protein H0H93_011452, partial [Arthromyces matolae]
GPPIRGYTSKMTKETPFSQHLEDSELSTSCRTDEGDPYSNNYHLHVLGDFTENNGQVRYNMMSRCGNPLPITRVFPIRGCGHELLEGTGTGEPRTPAGYPCPTAIKARGLIGSPLYSRSIFYLVTGITGFIAGQVANAFLEAGYRVRGTTRGEKAKLLGDTINVPGLEFVRVDDVVSDDLSEALKDVYAVIHVASPLPGRASVAETLSVRAVILSPPKKPFDLIDHQTAISGTLHVLKETTKAGIKKAVITSSFGALLDPDLQSGFAGLTFDHKSWGAASREAAEAKSEDDYYVYVSSKILAEKAVWDYAKEHPELDVATGEVS